MRVRSATDCEESRGTGLWSRSGKNSDNHDTHVLLIVEMFVRANYEEDTCHVRALPNVSQPHEQKFAYEMNLMLRQPK